MKELLLKYATEWYLDEHKTRMHSKNKQETEHLCTHCGATFQTRGGLLYHERCHLNLIKRSHASDICGYKTFASSALRKHKLTHTDERPFPCDHCGQSFKTEQSKKHIRDRLCEVGGKSYAFTSELKGHLMKVHKYDVDKARIAAGIKHKRVFPILPNGDRIFEREKIRKPKTCNICHKKYSRRDYLFTHLISVHRKTEDEAKEITRFESIRQKDLVSKCLRGQRLTK